MRGGSQGPNSGQRIENGSPWGRELPAHLLSMLATASAAGPASACSETRFNERRFAFSGLTAIILVDGSDGSWHKEVANEH
jgi:hypothetical protein